GFSRARLFLLWFSSTRCFRPAYVWRFFTRESVWLASEWQAERRRCGRFSQCGDDAIRMGLGHFAGCVAGRNDFVGDAGAGGIHAVARLVRLRTAVGPHADDQSIAGFAAALLAWVGDVPRATRNKAARDEADAGGRRHRDFVLRAVDGAKLHGISPADSA